MMYTERGLLIKYRPPRKYSYISLPVAGRLFLLVWYEDEEDSKRERELR